MGDLFPIVTVLFFLAINNEQVGGAAGHRAIQQQSSTLATTNESSLLRRVSDNCHCIDYNCGCCAHLQEKLIHLNNTICANATYLKRDYGFSLTVTFDKFTIFNETMSLRNPPPVCIGAPYVKEWAEVCVRLYDIQATKAHLHACVEVDADFKHIRVAKYDIGCFNMKGEEIRIAIQQLENEVL